MTEESSFRIVIAGGGTAGWMAAALLARFLPYTHSVTLVESADIGTVGVGEATIPQIRYINHALGLDEAQFLRETKGTFKLGIEFDGWRREGEAYMHAFGPVGRGHGLLPFHHYWLRAKQLGIVKTPAHYSLNETAARSLKMRRGSRTPRSPEMPYAYHFDAGLYAAFLRRYAEGRGVVRIEGTIGNVEQNSGTGSITALTLGEERRIGGDFFIDCTGFRALLIERTLKTGFDDWTDYLPCDRAMAVPCDIGGDFTPYTRSIARSAGWQWRIPLQHRIGNGLVYSSAHLSDEDAAETLLANLDGAPQGDPRPISFTTGKRRKHWNANCLALGLAAGFMEPLESTSIHLVQSAVSRFLSVLPAGEADPAIRDWFNGQADFEWSRIRDFLVLHYSVNEREGEPLWDAVRHMRKPDTLVAKLENWRAAGFIHREHEELFTEVGWFQVLAGQGLKARAYNPLADALSEDDLRSLLGSIEAACAEEARQMQSHSEFLNKFANLPPHQDAVA